MSNAGHFLVIRASGNDYPTLKLAQYGGTAAEQISELGPKLPKYKSQVINNYLKLP